MLAQGLGQPERSAEVWANYCQHHQNPETHGHCELLGWQDETGPFALVGLQHHQGSAQLKHLAIRPDRQRQGWGQKLLQALQQELKLYRLDAETDSAAVDFYRRCGFAILPLKKQWSPNSLTYKRYLCCWLDPAQVLQAEFRFPAPPIDQVLLPSPDGQRAPIPIHLLRLDLLHPLLSGNKWFKLRWNLVSAWVQEQREILTFGGAWSNHIFATAAAGRLFGFQTHGLIRGEELGQKEIMAENPQLTFAQDCGMHLRPLSRSLYRQKETEGVLKELRAQFPGALFIPEGGANAAGVQGTAEMLAYVPPDCDLLVTACGTASTLAGLISAAPSELKLLGISVLKGGNFLRDNVTQALQKRARYQPSNPHPPEWDIETRFHCGGYARSTPELKDFLKTFQALNSVPVEPVYTGKALYALWKRLHHREISAQKIVMIHSGGVYPWNAEHWTHTNFE